MSIDRNKLIEDNLGLVYKVVNGFKEFYDRSYGIYYYGYGERDDFISIGMLGLTKASRKYSEREENSAKFSTMAYTCIQNEIKSYIGSTRKKKRISNFNNHSLDELIYEENRESALKDYLDYYEDFTELEARELLELIDSFNFKNARYIVIEKAKGKKHYEIAKELGISHQAVSQSLMRVKEKLEEYGITA